MAEPKVDTQLAREYARFYEGYEAGRTTPAWYYRSREGVFGPFSSREAAEKDLADLLYRSPEKREQYIE